MHRARLWGFAEYSGKDYSHRKLWIVDQLSQLASIFTIDIRTYAKPNLQGLCIGYGCVELEQIARAVLEMGRALRERSALCVNHVR